MLFHRLFWRLLFLTLPALWVLSSLSAQEKYPLGPDSQPQTGTVSSVVFAGPEMSVLYATAGDKVFRRTIRAKGFFPGTALKPPRVQL